MLRQMGAAFCGVLIIFACSVPAKAAVKPSRFATRTKVHSDVTKLPPFTGAASTYNPFRPGPGEGGKLTASGENYSANGWTAAIQTNLRRFFSGVFSGKAYRPRFALVETAAWASSRSPRMAASVVSACVLPPGFVGLLIRGRV